jgi:hypothetical protein
MLCMILVKAIEKAGPVESDPEGFARDEDYNGLTGSKISRFIQGGSG